MVGRMCLDDIDMAVAQWVNDPIILGNDPIFSGSWRLQVSSDQNSYEET